MSKYLKQLFEGNFEPVYIADQETDIPSRADVS